MPEIPPPENWLDAVYYGNTLLAWVIALGAAAAVFLAGSFARRLIVGYATRHESGQRRAVARFLHQLARRLSMTVVLALAIMVAIQVLVLPAGVERGLRLVIIVALAWQFLRWGHAVVDFGLEQFTARHASDETTGAAIATSLGVVRALMLVALHALVALVAAQNMGVDVTALVAGMGIGGIAVALAVQNVLGDLFGSLSIVLDKPFVVGDFIVAGDQKGTVEKIGLKTTRVRSLSGEQLVFANTDLLSSRIQNFKRMNERRVSFTVGVPFDTPPHLLEGVAGMLTEAVKSQRGTRFERAYFQLVTDWACQFETIYYVLTTDLPRALDIEHEINLAVARRFHEAGVRFAVPVQRSVTPQEAAPHAVSMAAAPTAGGPSTP